jgi:hypothetical protein
MVVDCTLEGNGDWGRQLGASPQSQVGDRGAATELKIQEKALLVREFCKIMQDLLAA